jgi:hypothetical protein
MTLIWEDSLQIAYYSISNQFFLLVYPVRWFAADYYGRGLVNPWILSRSLIGTFSSFIEKLFRLVIMEICGTVHLCTSYWPIGFFLIPDTEKWSRCCDKDLIILFKIKNYGQLFWLFLVTCGDFVGVHYYCKQYLLHPRLLVPTLSFFIGIG